MTVENCPCKRVKCERHGNCEACREHHRTVKGTPSACDRLRATAERGTKKREKQV